MPKLIVTENDGVFECIKEGACGSPVCGYGASVVEAVGLWAIYTQTVEIVCDPPELLEKFTSREVKGFHPAPKRD